MVFLMKILYQPGHYNPYNLELSYDFQNDKWKLEMQHTKEIRRKEQDTLIEDRTQITIKADSNVKKSLIVNYVLEQLKAEETQKPEHKVDIPVHEIIIDGVSFMKELHPGVSFMKAQFIDGVYWLMFHYEECWESSREMTLWYNPRKKLWVHDAYCDCHPEKSKYKRVQKTTYGKDK